MELSAKLQVAISELRSKSGANQMTDTDSDTATLSRPTKIFFPKREEDAQPAKEPVVLDMGEASRLQGFRQNGCR